MPKDFMKEKWKLCQSVCYAKAFIMLKQKMCQNMNCAQNINLAQNLNYTQNINKAQI